MIIKYFDDFAGTWIDISGTTGSTLEYGASGWTATTEIWRIEGNIRQDGTDDPTLHIIIDNTGAGASLVATRVAAGEYNIYCPDAIFDTPTGGWQMLGNQSTSTEWGMFVMKRVDDNNIKIYTYEKDVLTDGLLDYTSFEFRYHN